MKRLSLQVGKLSGGEQSRLLLAKLMLKEANVLVLDEPTNDLDMATLAVLEECLTDFPGAVFLVTHDRYFLDQVATKILGFNAFKPETGKIMAFEGLGQWETWHNEQEAQAKIDAKKSKSGGGGAAAEAAKKQRKLSFNEQREFDGLEAKIHEAEELLARLTTESQESKNATNAVRQRELAKGMEDAQKEIDRLYARWTELDT